MTEKTGREANEDPSIGEIAETVFAAFAKGGREGANRGWIDPDEAMRDPEYVATVRRVVEVLERYRPGELWGVTMLFAGLAGICGEAARVREDPCAGLTSDRLSEVEDRLRRGDPS